MELIFSAAAIWLGYKLFRWWYRTARNDAYYKGYAASLDIDRAKEELRSARVWLRANAFIPGLSPTKEVEETFQKAVWLQDRVNALSGADHGAAFRARYRLELARQTNKTRTEASIAAANIPPPGSVPIREDRLSPPMRKLKRMMDEMKAAEAGQKDISSKNPVAPRKDAS